MKAKDKTRIWLQAHSRDSHVRKAQQDGWRSRAVFKLMAIDEKDKLLRPNQKVIDLGAAPGSWSQYITSKIKPNGQLVAVDLLPIAPLPAVTFVQGDACTEETAVLIEQALNGHAAQLVVSDMAPNITGIAATDQANFMVLIETALEVCNRHLSPQGDLLIKVFQNGNLDEIREQLRAKFATLVVRKPPASRARSTEVYLLARAMR